MVTYEADVPRHRDWRYLRLQDVVLRGSAVRAEHEAGRLRCRDVGGADRVDAGWQGGQQGDVSVGDEQFGLRVLLRPMDLEPGVEVSEVGGDEDDVDGSLGANWR